MGGVRVDETTATKLPGLFAAGEMMGGVHGGLRVSGFSFTQMIVFGLEAGRQAAAYAARGGALRAAPRERLEAEREAAEALLAPKPEPVRVRELKARLQALMERHAFVERDAAGLAEGLRGVASLKAELPRLQVPPLRRYNLDWVRALEFPFLLETAELVLRSALARQESRAFHCRTDYPEQDDARWLRHTLLRPEDGGAVVATAPVVLDRLKPEER
jgi:fumarate reductase flavoprotein subunit